MSIHSPILGYLHSSFTNNAIIKVHKYLSESIPSGNSLKSWISESYDIKIFRAVETYHQTVYQNSIPI